MVEREKEDFRKYYEIIGDKIGRGGLTIVYKARNKEKNEYRAIKVIDKDLIRDQYESENFDPMSEEEMNKTIEKFKNEIKYMKIMEGKNKENKKTVKYYEHFNTEKELAIVMELCDNNLVELMKNKDKGLNMDEIYNILFQLNNSFKIMNENKIVHRDLKFENILIKYENKEKKDKYIVKLGDYGLSKQLMNMTHFSTRIGTPKYEAPEILEDNNENKKTEKCDLWSLGIIIYRLCFKEFPFIGKNENAVLNSIKSKQIKLKKVKNKENKEKEELNDIIEKLLIIDPNKRMSWNEYFNHSFFKKNIIKIKIRINYYDINRDIYFLNKINHYYSRHLKELKELNESNVELYINNEKMKFKKYFNPEKEGLYEIKLIIKIDIKNCSCMFCDCKNITNLDLSSLDTKNVTDMSYMFYNCENITNLDLSSFDTKNVTDMSYMFYNCNKLTNLYLSSFDYEINVDKSLKEISDLAEKYFKDSSKKNSFKEKLEELEKGAAKLKDEEFEKMEVLHHEIEVGIKRVKFINNISLKNKTNLNLSSFDTKNVKNMNDMFSGCENITNLNLSFFDTKNVKNMNNMFKNCKNITNLNLSSFDAGNVRNMREIFYNCNKLKLITIKKNMNNISYEIGKENKNIKIIRI